MKKHKLNFLTQAFDQRFSIQVLNLYKGIHSLPTYYNDKIFESKIDYRSYFNNLSDLLKLENKDAVMFGISKKDNCIFVYKEDRQDDSYIVSKALSRGSYSRFASKELAKDIVNYLELDKKQVLEVAIKGNKQDYFFKIAGEVNGKVKLIEYKV